MKNKKVKTRLWRMEDVPSVVDCQRSSYQDLDQDTLYDIRLYEMQFTAFPEGQVLAELDSKVVGYATSLIVQLDDDNHRYTYEEITGAATFSSHTPSGDTLYGADIGVHPDFRGKGIAGLLYEMRRRIMRRLNLRRMVAYGRIPGYSQYAGKMTAEEYVTKVEAGELADSALNAHLKAGYRVKRVILDHITDSSSLNYCTLLEMPNPDFKPERRRIAASPLKRPIRKIRVCAAQYLMRPIDSWEEIETAVKFFVDTADTYYCHFVVFPELFTAQLFSTFPNGLDLKAAVMKLTEYTERYLALFSDQARQNRLFIIGGSHPVLRDGKIFNVAHLFSPSGNIYTQDKLHLTPGERNNWGIEPGLEMKVFDTSFGRIAIQVCYDIEFPELSRLQTLAGAEVIFVPFSTDERKAYHRVRFTAQARAVENYVYVVIAGCVGNLPNKNYLLNYGQAAVFTPSDFGFPPEATAGEAALNIETVVVVDLDINTLMQQREVGSVRPPFRSTS